MKILRLGVTNNGQLASAVCVSCQ